MPPQRLSAAARGGPEASRGYPDRSTVADGRVELALAFRIAHGPKPRLSSTPVMVPPTVSGVRCLSACTVRQRDEVPVQRAFRMILQKALLRTQRRRGRRPASHRSTTRPGLGGPGRVRRPRAEASVAAPDRRCCRRFQQRNRRVVWCSRRSVQRGQPPLSAWTARSRGAAWAPSR